MKNESKSQKEGDTDYIESKQENFDYWKNYHDYSLEEAYSKIASNIPLVDVRNKDLFIERTKKYYYSLFEHLDFGKMEKWDEYDIIRMFGKGLNPTSLKTALNNIKFFVEHLESKNGEVRVVEFGPGSGWSTIMLREQLLKKFPDKKIKLFTIDSSPYSVVSTQNSLDYNAIPWQTVIRIDNIKDLERTSENVNIVLDGFINFLENQDDNTFDGFFSSHGTAYLSEEEYSKLLKLITQKGERDSIFVADSLDPLYTVDLSVLHLFLCSLFPRIAESMEEYFYGKSLISNSKYFPGAEVKKLVKVNNKESLLFYRWNNYLLSRFKIAYIFEMFKSIRITTDVIEEYREDVYPSYLVAKLVDREGLRENFTPLPGLPKCPLYISNCGFKLTK